MKSNRTLTALTVIVLWTMLLTFGCGSPTNINVSQNQNVNTGRNANSAALTPPADPCVGTDPQAIANHVNTYLDTLIATDASMTDVKDQVARGLFKYKAVVTTTPVYPPTNPPSNDDSVYLYLGGRLGDSRKPGHINDNFQPFLTFVKNHHKRACVNKVVFVPLGSVPTTITSLGIPPINGFEWFGCDYPNVPCPGGECAVTCQPLTN